jgi:hypothetical protein
MKYRRVAKEFATVYLLYGEQAAGKVLLSAGITPDLPDYDKYQFAVRAEFTRMGYKLVQQEEGECA